MSDTTTVPRSHGERRRLTSYLSVAHLVMLVAGALAFLLVALVLRDRDATAAVVVAATDLEVGATVGAGSLRIVEMPADVLRLDGLAAPSLATTAAQEGWRMRTPITAGAPLRAGDVTSAEPHGPGSLMAITMDPSRAVGGAVSAGDRIDVIHAGSEAAVYAAVDLEVVAVDAGGSRSGLSGITLTVVVTPETALLVAAALSRGEVHVVRSGGAVLDERSSG